MIDLNLDIEANRRAARTILARFEALRVFSFEQVATAARWLLASLLAINGGGALATINSVGRLESPLHPAACFTAGICLVLLSAVVIQHATGLNLTPVERISYYWREVEVDGIRVASIEADNDWDLRWRRWIGHLAPILGWLSAAAFVLGVMYLSEDAQSRPANNRRCLAIQHDMLSARPRRTDDADLFQALGCRPQGEGSVYAPPPSSSLHRSPQLADR